MPMTFRVNLATLNPLTHRQPYNATEATNFAATRLAYFPDININNHYIKDGITFTASGYNAVYLLNNYTSGEFKFLDYVSGTSV